jgi:hypothetical protein
MQSKNNFAPRRNPNLAQLFQDPENINSLSLDLKTEFKQWRRANRILSRHWVIAERLGGRAIRSARWERGMIMLRGIHIEIGRQMLDPQKLQKS